MPRAKGIPSYCLHSATGQARCIVNGRSIYLGLYDSPESKAEYERVVRKLLADRSREELKRRVEITNDLTLAELTARYLAFAIGYYVKNGQSTTEYGNIVLAVRTLHDKPDLACEFGPAKLKALRESWVESGIVRPQVNKRVDRVRRMFAWAVENELVDESVLSALRSVRGLRAGRSDATEGKKVLPVDDSDVDAIRPYVATQVWTMVTLQRLTGMRSGEVTTMRTCDLDTIGETWVYVPSSHKGEHHGRTRKVFLGPRAIAVLKTWLRPDVESYLFQPRESMQELWEKRRAARKTKVQPSQEDRRLKRPRKLPSERYMPSSYRRAIVEACKRAGCPEWHPHQLRHVVATMLRREEGLDVARVALGHSSVAVTAMYAEADERKAADAMRRFG
jgi:integrase